MFKKVAKRPQKQHDKDLDYDQPEPGSTTQDITMIDISNTDHPIENTEQIDKQNVFRSKRRKLENGALVSST